VQLSEPSIFTKYQAKPQLFDEDTREKGLLNFGAGQGKTVLENFKANKNKIKDKYDRYVPTANSSCEVCYHSLQLLFKR